MTDYTHYERFMTRDELALRLNMETALRECCESECAKLKKELEALEDIKAAFEIKQRDNLNRCEEIMKLREDYDCAREKFVTEFNNVTYNYECALKEIERLREKVTNQKTQLNGVQQALGNRNIKIEALNCEVDRLKKEVKERRVVFEPTSYLIDIQTKDEEIKALRKKNLDLKNENEDLKLKYDQVFLNKNKEITALKDEIEALKDALHDDEVEIHKTQPLYIENLNVTYYANGPIWTNEEDEDDISGSDDQN